MYDFCLLSENSPELIKEINDILNINGINNIFVTNYVPAVFSTPTTKNKVYNIEFIESDSDYIECIVPNKQTYLIMEGNVLNKLKSLLNVENRGIVSIDYNTDKKHPRLNGIKLPYIDGCFYRRKLKLNNIDMTTIYIKTKNIDINKVAYIISEEIARNVGKFISKNLPIKKKSLDTKLNIVTPKTLEVGSNIKVNDGRRSFKVEGIKLIDGVPKVCIDRDVWIDLKDIKLI